MANEEIEMLQDEIIDELGFVPTEVFWKLFAIWFGEDAMIDMLEESIRNSDSKEHLESYYQIIKDEKNRHEKTIRVGLYYRRDGKKAILDIDNMTEEMIKKAKWKLQNMGFDEVEV